MFEFFDSNPLIALAIGVVIVFVLMFIFVKPPKSKKKHTVKTDKKTSTDKPEKSDKEEKVEQPTTSDAAETSNVKKKKHLKKAKTKPEITQVYKRTVGQQKTSNEIKDENNNGVDDDLESRAQFVKTSNKVSKFIGLSDVVNQEESEMVQEGFSEMPVSDFDENCDDCQKKVRHFDHSRRLSKMIQEDSFDDMLEAHISDKYLNINADKHLGVSPDFAEKLYGRAMNTISNSDIKVLVESETEEKPVEQIRNDKDYMKTWLEQRRHTELSKLMMESGSSSDEVLSDDFVEEVKTDIDLTPKNIIVVDAVLNRKSRNKK